MATVESPPRAAQNGAGGRKRSGLKPATGQTITDVPDMGADEVRDVVGRARRAQPAWESIGFDVRAEVMYAARRWLIQNRDRMTDTIVEETGKTREDAQLAEIFFI